MAVPSPHVAFTAAEQSGRPLLCPLCCPYTLVDTAILPRQLCLLHPGPGPGPQLHPTQFFQPQLPTPSQVQKQLELVNRLSANWGWKILYQSQWSRGMEQLREEARRRNTGLERWRVARMTGLDKDEGRSREMQKTHGFCLPVVCFTSWGISY